MKQQLQKMLDGTESHPLDLPSFYLAPVFKQLEKGAEILREATGVDLAHWVVRARVGMRIWNLGIPLRTPSYVASAAVLMGSLGFQTPQSGPSISASHAPEYDINHRKEAPQQQEPPAIDRPPRRPRKIAGKDPIDPPSINHDD